MGAPTRDEDEEILWVGTISQRNINSMTNQAFCWSDSPGCCNSEPFCCCKVCKGPAYKAMLASTTYTLTDRALVRQVDYPRKDSCLGVGNKSGRVRLTDVKSMGTKRPDDCPCWDGKNPFPVPTVFIELPPRRGWRDPPGIADHLWTTSGFVGTRDTPVRSLMKMIVDDPKEVMRLIRAAKKRMDRIAGGGPTPLVMGRPVDEPLEPLDKIKKLKELKDAGAISEASYKAKKDELMEQI